MRKNVQYAMVFGALKLTLDLFFRQLIGLQTPSKFMQNLLTQPLAFELEFHQVHLDYMRQSWISRPDQQQLCYNSRPYS